MSSLISEKSINKMLARSVMTEFRDNKITILDKIREALSEIVKKNKTSGLVECFVYVHVYEAFESIELKYHKEIYNLFKQMFGDRTEFSLECKVYKEINISLVYEKLDLERAKELLASFDELIIED